MKAIVNSLLIVGATAFFTDAICYGDFESFVKGFISCGLILNFFDEL